MAYKIDVGSIASNRKFFVLQGSADLRTPEKSQLALIDP
jgi:hypothetical protein